MDSDEIFTRSKARLINCFPNPALESLLLTPNMIKRTQGVVFGKEPRFKAGLGKQLINFAFDLVKISSESIGCFGMYFDADPQAIDFYTSLGFSLLEGNKNPHPSPMFIPVSAIP